MMELTADTGLTILTYTAEPGSKSEEALNLLGSWAATLDRAEPANVTDERLIRAGAEVGACPRPSTSPNGMG